MITRIIVCNRLYYSKEGQPVKQQRYKLRLNIAAARRNMITAEDVSNKLLTLLTYERKDLLLAVPLDASNIWECGGN